jgi:outer membrane immunogenic protein
VETEVQRFIVALIALTALTLAYASGAFAADMAFPNFGKMPPPPMLAKAPPAPPATDWTGFYVGGDAGAAFANTPATWNPLPSAPAFGAFPISGHDRDTAFVGGGHAGYDYQFMPDWVGGIEGDWTWAKARGSLTQPWVAEPGFAVNPGSVTTMSTSLDWLASARGRVGYLVAPNILAYATGGIAWARLDYAASNTDTVAYSTSAALSRTATGYAIGGGVEWEMTCNWFVRAQYLYYRFDAGPSVIAQAVSAPASPSGYSWSNTAVSVATGGLSYKF